MDSLYPCSNRTHIPKHSRGSIGSVIRPTLRKCINVNKTYQLKVQQSTQISYKGMYLLIQSTDHSKHYILESQSSNMDSDYTHSKIQAKCKAQHAEWHSEVAISSSTVIKHHAEDWEILEFEFGFRSHTQ